MSAPHEPTDAQRASVRVWSTSGVGQEQIADALGIDAKTLRKHYREELTVGAAEWRVEFEAGLKRRVMRPDAPPALVIFTAKTQLGWSEKSELLLNQGEGGRPKKNPEDMTELELFREIVAITSDENLYKFLHHPGMDQIQLDWFHQTVERR